MRNEIKRKFLASLRNEASMKGEHRCAFGPFGPVCPSAGVASMKKNDSGYLDRHFFFGRTVCAL
jgi:hypothetical protein